MIKQRKTFNYGPGWYSEVRSIDLPAQRTVAAAIRFARSKKLPVQSLTFTADGVVAHCGISFADICLFVLQRDKAGNYMVSNSVADEVERLLEKVLADAAESSEVPA